MPDVLLDTPADAGAREAALDISRSVIVQAPAGSGKTDLLTRRFLKLLAAVDEPEEILAITFTRAAAAEMRARILSDLGAAARQHPRPDPSSRIALAHAALAHAERRGWKLLEQPQRLAVETIDSLCLRIAHDRPLLAHLGGHLQPIEEATALYALAARRTLEQLGSANTVLSEALAHLLDLRDNRLAGCEELLANMLAVRDQWQHAFPLSGDMTEENWESARIRLQAPFSREVRRVISEAHRMLIAEPTVAAELLHLASYACTNGNDRVSLLTGIDALSASMPIEHWRCLCDFLLTSGGEWRRRVAAPEGFPAGPAGSEERRQKDAMAFVLARLRQMPQLLAALSAIRDLPPPTYTEAQWTTLRHILTVLRHAIAELKVVFAQRNSVDFTEIALSALEVFRRTPERVAGNVRHLLIDEFQDTSRRQHELITALLSAWDPGEGRTCFLVGDPMQSIYMFRQAEVELFAQVRDHGVGPENHRIPCHPVQLSVNFRSHAGLTDPLNLIFAAICAEQPPPGSAAVPFARSTSSEPAPPEASVHVHPHLIGSVDRRPVPDDYRDAQDNEAQTILRILEPHLPLIEEAHAAGAEYRVAILVRARTHLAQLVPLLRRKAIPFRAVEIEHLSDRQELLDLLALTRALLHPMDRIAWLSVLRAPWCGLTLSDLHRLTGADRPQLKDLPVLELIDRHHSLLSADGQLRLARTADILRRALDLRWRQSESPSFASWIERTWRTLGGPACVDAAACENAEVFFSLLDSIAPDGLAAFTGDLHMEFERLFAQPDPAVSERCGIQLMTIHKAKGLGFDVVIVPGLDRQSSSDPLPLISSLERVSPWNGETEFLVAPIGEQGGDTDPLYKWVEKQRKIRFDEERKRLFYVACTRARRELHLPGTAVVTKSGVSAANRDSLLQTAWPALRADFEAALHERQIPSSQVHPLPAAPGIVEELAAVADPAPRLILRRLRFGADPLPVATNVTVTGSITPGQGDAPEFLRPQGSRQARITGSVVHTLLQRLGPELARCDRPQLRARATSLLRAVALTGESLASATEAVTKILLTCQADPVCRWILAPHPEAQSEAAWSVFLPGESGARLRTLRADRVFRAGPGPETEGSDFLWVIDYKTSSAPSGTLFLEAERALYEPQLLAYARALRALHGPETRLRLGLYYPAIAAFDYWDPGLF